LANFEISFRKTKRLEGGYSNRKADAGGATNYGITKLTAMRHGYFKSMKYFTLAQAKKIYKKSYWDNLKLSDIRSQKLANKIFDVHVNCGGVVKKFLQRSLNVFNKYGRLYPDLKIDGKIGPITIRTLNTATKDPRILSSIIKAITCLQGARYIRLAENKKRRDQLNILGWFLNRI